MQATRDNVFALENSGLEPFLYADIGAEPNGTALTVLSMIARLGRDPWAEAARWGGLPEGGAIDNLAQSIAQMPLVQSGLAEARATATRIVRLLPAPMPGISQGAAANAEAPPVPGWLPITILYCAISLGMAFSTLLTPRPSQAIVTPNAQSVAIPGEPVAGMVPLVHDQNIVGPASAPSGPQTR